MLMRSLEPQEKLWCFEDQMAMVIQGPPWDRFTTFERSGCSICHGTHPSRP
jgi:hypothetical protein